MVVGIGAVVGIGNAGRTAILNTTDGELLVQEVPEDRFPDTPVTALAVLDDDELSSLVVLVAAPGGSPGGTIVVVPVNADITSGYGDEPRPLDGEVAAASGSAADLLAVELPLLLGVSIDTVEVLDTATLTDDVRGLGADPDAARVLAARPPAPVLAAYADKVDAWRAVAAIAPIAPGDGSDEAVGRWTSIFAGAVDVAALTPHARADGAVAGVDVAVLDQVETVVLFAHLAPARVAAPNPGFNFRIVSGFADDQLDGTTRYGLAQAAAAGVLAAEHNVLSVDTTAATAASATVVEVGDAGLLDSADALARIFGPVEVRLAERRVAGVDVVVTLGTDFIPVAAGSNAAADTTDAGTVPASEEPIDA